MVAMFRPLTLFVCHWVCRGRILLCVLWIWLLEFYRSLPPTSYWVWTSCKSTTRTWIGLKTPCHLYLILILWLLMLAWYRVPFVQDLFLLALGFVSFVLNLTWIALWRWCILVIVVGKSCGTFAAYWPMLALAFAPAGCFCGCNYVCICVCIGCVQVCV